MAMTQHMPALPVRIIRKVCIATAFLISLLVLHLNKGITQKDEERIHLKSSLFPSPRKTTLELNSSSFTPHRPEFPSQLSHEPKLPSLIKIINASDFSHPKPSHQSNDNSTFNFTCMPAKCSPSFTVCMYETSVDRYISWALRSSGIWEPFQTTAFQVALEKHPDATVVDIGANIGYYSLLASSRNHDVIAIEPHKENQRRLLAGYVLTKRRHKAVGRVLLLGNALSDGHRLVSLSRSSDNQGALRVVEGCPKQRSKMFGFLSSLYYSPSETPENDLRYGFHMGNSLSRSCDIPTLTMDDLLLVIKTPKAIIKMDIEGYECRAMGQASKFLTLINVPYIFTEWRPMREHQHDLDTTCSSYRIRRLSSALSDLGYVPHEVHSGIRLNPYDAPNWRVGDVYWRQNNQPLLVPSM